MKNTMKAAAVAALFTVSAFALTVTSASAAVVCNQEGDCWHAKKTYEYQPAFGVTVHEDSWKWDADRDHNRWREHPGRGYWRNGVWIKF
jgi:hypothetical protein